MSPRSRDPIRAFLAIGAALAVLLAAGLLPAFGGAAPLEEIARELGPDVDAPDAPDAPDSPGGGEGGGGLPAFRFPFDFDVGFGDGDGDLLPDGGGDGASPGSGGSGGGGGSIVEFVLEPLFEWGSGGGNDTGERRRGMDCERSGGYLVCLPETLYPGRPMSVRVEGGGEPVSGETVRVNGDPVGSTDGQGQAFARTPYTEEVRVAVENPTSVDPAAEGGPAPGDAVVRETHATASIDLPDDPDPGQETRVTVEYEDGVGAPHVPVSVDGERIARTGDEGYATVSMPAAKRATVSAAHGAVRVERDAHLFDVQVIVGGPLGVPLPGTAPTVQVLEAGDPLRGATVTVDGRGVGRTGHNGTVSAELPLAPTATITVDAAGVSHTATQHLWVGPAVALLLAAGVVGAGTRLWRRTEASGRDVLAEARVVLQTAGRRLTDWLVALAANAEEALAAALGGMRALLADLEAPSVALTAAVRARLAALLAWLDPRPRLVTVGERVRRRFGRTEATAEAATGEPPGARDRVERAWARLVGRLDLVSARTMTPGQVARRAVAAGLPRRAVRRLTRAFRAVEYADADPEAYAEEVERAVGELDCDDEEGTS